MGDTQQTVPTGWYKFAIYGGWVGTFVLAAWIVLPRLIIGTTVPITWTITILLPVLLIAIGSVTLGLPASRGLMPTKRSEIGRASCRDAGQSTERDVAEKRHT